MRGDRTLSILLLAYGAGTLVHFIHNAEFIGSYPGMPATWTRAGVYLAWLAMTGIGIAGWLMLRRGYRLAGLAAIALYAMLGLDSLGHYVLAPLSAHTLAMNATILLEVTAAGLVLLAAARELPGALARRRA